MRDALSTSVTTPRPRRMPAPAMPPARPAAPAPIERTPRMRRLETPPMSVTTHATPDARRADIARTYPMLPSVAAPRLGSATAGPALPMPYTGPRPGQHADPDVWLIALPTASGSFNALEGSARAGAIRVARPYGHLRSIRPVTLGLLDPTVSQSAVTPSRGRRGGSGAGLGSASAAQMSNLPALRPLPSVVSAVEVETDAGVFRVERPDSVLAHGDLAWALANLEQGEPDPNVPLPRRQLALLLTLLPTPQDPEQLADKLYGAGDRAIGKPLYFGILDGGSATIVGVVERLQGGPYFGPNSDFVNEVVLAPGIPSGHSIRYIVRTQPGRRDAVMNQVEREFESLQPGRYIEQMQTLASTAERNRATDRNGAVILAILCSLCSPSRCLVCLGSLRLQSPVASRRSGHGAPSARPERIS